MKNKKIKILTTLAVLGTFVLQFSSCGSVNSDFKEVLSIVGNKTLKGGSKIGLLSGRSMWKFDGNDLAIMYSAKMNTTIEKTILDNGDEEWTKEEYSIENLEPSYVYDETKNIVRKQYWGDWGNARFVYTLETKDKPKNKTASSSESNLINYWSDAYILFQVIWSNSHCSVRHYLTVEEKEKIFDTYIITDESDENFISAKNDHIKQVAQEVAQEMYWDITKEKNTADDYIKSNKMRNKYHFKANNSIYINEKNATIPHDSAESALFLKTKNASVNSIILNGKKLSIDKFKGEIVKNINSQIEALDVLNYLYVATNEYGIQRNFYYFPDTEDKTYSELGNEGDVLPEYRKYFDKINEAKLNRGTENSDFSSWDEDIFLVLFKEKSGKMGNLLFKYNQYGKGYFSTYNPDAYTEKNNYSLYDRLSEFAWKYDFPTGTRSERAEYSFRMEDLIGYYTTKFLYKKLNGFNFEVGNDDKNYVIIKISKQDNIFSKVKLERKQDSFSWDLDYDYEEGDSEMSEEEVLRQMREDEAGDS